MGLAAVERPVIGKAALKGYLLEEVVAFLISKAGFRLLTHPNDDPVDLAWMGNGLQVRGRGGFHQADVLGELAWAPAFSNPIRLFIEAKWRSGGDAVGIPEVRHAVGILQDINQSISTVRQQGQMLNDADDVIIHDRSFCYAYRYALCSTSGFSRGAQAYGIAHQIALIDLSGDEFRALRRAVGRVGDDLQSTYAANRELHDRAMTRPRFLQQLRGRIRREFWGYIFAHDEMPLPSEYETALQPLFEAAKEIQELFVGISATGFLLLLKADNSKLMLSHMKSNSDPVVQIHWNRNAPENWIITVHEESNRREPLEPCELSFRLPKLLLKALESRGERGRSSLALNIKGQHFSRITVMRATKRKMLICTLNLDQYFLADARRKIEADESR